jgi:hypothetical protein
MVTDAHKIRVLEFLSRRKSAPVPFIDVVNAIVGLEPVGHTAVDVAHQALGELVRQRWVVVVADRRLQMDRCYRIAPWGRRMLNYHRRGRPLPEDPLSPRVSIPQPPIQNWDWNSIPGLPPVALTAAQYGHPLKRPH